MVQVAAFYRFVTLCDPKGLRGPIREAAAAKGVRGTVLLAPEGINGTVSGVEDDLQDFLLALESFLPGGGIVAKYSHCTDHPFNRLRVRLKREIVTLGVPGVDPTDQVGVYVRPTEWNELVRDPKVALIDVRNSYEVALGTFEGAIDPQTEDFRQFPEWVESNLPDKNAPVAMFCTGGIRCEKATSLLLARGFTQVFHLEGGILNYLAQVEPTESTWQGSCYVFDQRGSLDHQLDPVGENLQKKGPGGFPPGPSH